MSNKRNVLIISTPDIITASGIIAFDLHQGLNHFGMDSKLLVRYTKQQRKGLISYDRKLNVYYSKIKRRLKKKKNKVKTDINYYFFDIDQRKNIVDFNKIKRKIKKPDIIIAYFMYNFFSLKDIFDLQKNWGGVPVILIMADQVFITGGCHYKWDCEGYKSHCENCPAILEKGKKIYAKQNIEFNRELIKKMNITLVSGSKQDYNLAKESFLFHDKPIYKIIGGIDLSIFNSNDNREILRKKYSIRKNDFTILYGAVNTEEKRKGLHYFVEVIKRLNKLKSKINFTIVTIGRGDFELSEFVNKINFINLGFIKNYDTLAEIYNVVDVLLSTSIQDSGPMMINQSLACGTPVVSFDIGVAQDIVIDGQTGYKAELYDMQALFQGVLKIAMLKGKDYIKMRENCVKLAVNKFSKEKSAENFIKIINNLLK